LKGTLISTPSGGRLVQDLRIGDEVQTLAGRKTIKWIGYNKFTKEESRGWHDWLIRGEEAVSPVLKRSIVIAGHKTSISLEDEFWNSFKEIASERGMTVARLVGAIDADRKHINLSSAIRLFVLGVYRDQLVSWGRH
jgi:predicted DNA-binding ribbon-helix-helix protein